MAENIQQTLQLATTNTQLAILTTFSNDSEKTKLRQQFLDEGDYLICVGVAVSKFCDLHWVVD
jgi:hypothetical protein